MRRIVVPLMAVLVTVLVAACGEVETTASASPSAPASRPTASKSPTREPSLFTATSVPRPPTEAKVVRIIDGDTVEVDIGGITFLVRYIGIDSPEADAPLGPEATEANRQLVEYKTVRMVADISEVDEYDRLLRYVYVGDLLVNAEMVRLGYARAVSYPPNVAHDDLFAGAELQARQAGVGLWAGLAQSAAQISVDAACCQFDAPGNDDENKVEEYVCLRNDGPEAFDLTGYILSDEHGWTYHFAAFTLDAGATVRVRTGCGQDTASDVYWCHEGTSAIWNNDGDTVFLFSPEGELLLEHSY